MTLKEKRAILEAEGYSFEVYVSRIDGRRFVSVLLNGTTVCFKDWPERPHVSKYIRAAFEHRPHHDWQGNDLRDLRRTS